MAGNPSRTLKLTYLGDASQLSKSTNKAGDDVQTLGNRVGKVGKALAVGFVAISAAGVAMGRKLFQAFEEVSTANARVESIVTSMGNFQGELEGVTERIIKQAEATARLTGVDRNLIKESQALLLTFDSVNKTADEAGGIFDRATDAAVDLAAAGFGSATSNAQSLGRALEDPVRGLTSLTRQGVTFTAEQQELIKALVESNQTLEAQDIILKAIETQVGGTAAATSNGSDRIAQSFGILKETIAQQLAPEFENLTAIAERFIERFGEWWAENGDDIIESFRTFATRVKDSAIAFKDFVGDVVDELRERGVFERVKEQARDTGRSFIALADAFGDFRSSISGAETQTAASLFASYIDFYFVKPIEFLLDRIEKLNEGLAIFLTRAARVADFFRGRGVFGGDFFGGVDLPADFVPGTVAPSIARPGAVTNNITVTGALDPEGTARTVNRILSDQVLRSGVRPSEVRAALR
jgi:hypothetical protein